MITNTEWFENNKEYIRSIGSTIKSNSIEIPISLAKNSITLTNKDIRQLSEGNLPANKEFVFFENYGFSYRNYTEVFLSFEDPSFRSVRIPFSIGPIKYEVSDYSNVAYLLLTNYFESNSEIYHDIGFMNDSNLSLKIVNSPYESILDNAEKALYYLNSHYMKKINFAISIFDLPLSWDSTYDDSEISRKRSRKRKDFTNIIPIKLYNYACNQRNDSRFLSFYRVLEYYFQYAIEDEIKELRFNKSITNKVIIKKIKELQSEKEALSLLIKKVVPKHDLDYYQKLLQNNKLLDLKSGLSNQLYQFRCSLVHAKSNMEDFIYVPDFRENDKSINIWTTIVKALSEKCIKIFEEK